MPELDELEPPLTDSQKIGAISALLRLPSKVPPLVVLTMIAEIVEHGPTIAKYFQR